MLDRVEELSTVNSRTGTVTGRGGVALASAASSAKSARLPSLRTLTEHKDAALTSDEIWSNLADSCTRFVFPDGMAVKPQAMARLVTWAKYGPATADHTGGLRLRGSQRLLQPFEAAVLVAEETRAMVADLFLLPTVHNRREGAARNDGRLAVVAPNVTAMALPDAAFGPEMVGGQGPLGQQTLELSRNELAQLLADCQASVPASQRPPHKAKRSTLFDMLSDAVLAERRRRIMAAQLSDATPRSIRRDELLTNRRAVTIYNHTHPKAFTIAGFEQPHHVLRSLHRHASQIADISDGNNPAVAANVRCLRPEYVAPPGAVREGWDGYCCLRSKNPSAATTLRR